MFQVCLRAEDDPQSPNGPSATPLDPSGPPTRSRHSPPVSRPTSEYNHHLEVKMYQYKYLLREYFPKEDNFSYKTSLWEPLTVESIINILYINIIY